MPKENVDYELVPSENHDDQAWNVRFLSGDYTETVIQYGAIKLIGENQEKDDATEMSFNFDVVSSPDPDLSASDISLQNHAGDVLLDIIEQAILNGSIETKESNEKI
jgi:hypothetical protein